MTVFRECYFSHLLFIVLRVYPLTGFLDWQVGEVYAPHALPMFREEQNSKKRKERSDRKDPVRSKKPDPPVSEAARPAFGCCLFQRNVLMLYFMPALGIWHCCFSESFAPGLVAHLCALDRTAAHCETAYSVRLRA